MLRESGGALGALATAAGGKRGGGGWDSKADAKPVDSVTVGRDGRLGGEEESRVLPVLRLAVIKDDQVPACRIVVIYHIISCHTRVSYVSFCTLAKYVHGARKPGWLRTLLFFLFQVCHIIYIHVSQQDFENRHRCQKKKTDWFENVLYKYVPQQCIDNAGTELVLPSFS